MPVVVVGPLAFDDVRTPAEERSGLLGGSGAYASIAAAKLAPTALVSVAGDDLTDEDLGPLVAAGVEVGGIERRAGRTLRWSGTYDATGTKSDVRNTDLGVVAGWRPRIPRAWLDTPYVLLANTDPAAQAAALAQLRPALAVLDTITPAGSLIVPAYPTHAFDPTGAGDALAGAFTARLAALGRADEPALRDALAHGMAAASFAIGSFSVWALTRATREEIETRARWLGARARLGTDQAANLYEGR